MNIQTSNCCTSPCLHHGLQTSATLWQHLSFHQRHLGYTKKDFKVMPNITYGMILTYGDSTMIKCILDAKITSILQFCHAALGGGHYGSTWIARKVIHCGFYWPSIFKDAYQFVSTCEKFQKDEIA
ncbi:hypothetical protein CR513_28147, partial [Mucuna pruriens]